MRKSVLFLVSIVLLVVLPSVADQQQLNGSAKRSIHISALRFSDSLAQLARTYQIVIGLEEAQDPVDEKVLSFSVENSSISEALDRLVRADPRYKWRAGADGAIHVQSLGSTPSLGSVVFSVFSIHNLRRREISNLLDDQPEFRNWIIEHKCQRVEYTIGHDWDADLKPISLFTTGKTMRDNLDLVALATETYFWKIVQLQTSVGCQVSVRF